MARARGEGEPWPSLPAVATLFLALLCLGTAVAWVTPRVDDGGGDAGWQIGSEADAESVPSGKGKTAPREGLQGSEGHQSPSPTTYGLLGEGVVRTSSVDGLEETARALLEGYHVEGTCVLLDSGYLDLFGNVWSCTVLGDGWVEVTVVRARPEGAGSDVTTVHMDAGDWSEELGGTYEGLSDADEAQVDACEEVGYADGRSGDVVEVPGNPGS